MAEDDYVIATIRPWDLAAYDSIRSELAGRWHLITDRSDLSPGGLAQMRPPLSALMARELKLPGPWVYS